MSVINFWIVNSVIFRIHSVTDFVLCKIIVCLENNKQGSYFSALVCLMFDDTFITPLPLSVDYHRQCHAVPHLYCKLSYCCGY